uniref:Putative polyprotein n=1 Tax=Albugo laibachii Nc14 TaxID=890382 RepID=F0X2M1_9STRA|nr:putative polyprotein [Albugo laibachii Nc14]|eukprot:CCA28135.1 putative polyprotein [Albugo laibachii Nc14]
MVKLFKQGKANSVTNPFLEGQSRTKMEQEDPRMKNRPYRSLVGSLLYISTGTRPDIAFSVCQLIRHLEKPSEEHWNVAIRVLRYLKTTASNGIIYQEGKNWIQTSAYSDADWASNKDSRKSMSGTMDMINESPVIFKSKFQR